MSQKEIIIESLSPVKLLPIPIALMLRFEDYRIAFHGDVILTGSIEKEENSMQGIEEPEFCFEGGVIIENVAVCLYIKGEKFLHAGFDTEEFLLFNRLIWKGENEFEPYFLEALDSFLESDEGKRKVKNITKETLFQNSLS